jgi:site-specific DNA-methyltransferase (adenine-specific)
MIEPYYSDDLVTLYHGDCREVTAWLEADVLVTDPPYGVAWGRRFGDARLGTKGRRTASNVVEGDRDTSARDAALDLWGSRAAIVFGSWRVERPSTALKALLIWHKEGSYSGPSRAPFFTNHEEIYVMGEGVWPVGSPLRSVITTTEARHHEPRRTGHPTSKPLPLMEALLAKCPPGTIADPFAGSGTTLLAARNLDRKAIGVEIDEAYCEVIAKRLSQGDLFGGVA